MLYALKRGGLSPGGHRGSLLPDDQVNVDRRINLEGGDVLHDGGGAVDVDDSLVDSHFVSVPGVGSFTAGGLSGGDSENLGGDSDGASRLVALVLSSNDDLIAGPFEGLHFSSLQGHSDALDFLEGLFTLGLFLIGVHS
eukprot:CAMPEP_0170483464 /NCGR_PEP_ID=MMETSP0208-20121228/3129_1 /TAXON_ID=197538 /ORGANISM="Strombidium inclinatum, Strain S3" /LENGTH=138 /DNA_ID=CAMNT_0010756507 /DNA_START=129 /DNA_END=546 /DNA_ORIENTATION=-